MNPAAVLLFKKTLSSWVFADPRRFHLFGYLLMKADEKGYVNLSIRDYCKQYGQERNFVTRLLKQMEDEGICESIVSQKRTIIFLCNYARYNGSENKSEPIMSQNAANNVENGENLERKKPSPHTPFKEEKDKADTEVATLQENEEKAAGAKSSSRKRKKSSEDDDDEDLTLPIPAGTLDERRIRFWADICHCAARHPDWTREGVESFYDWWTELSSDGLRFKFESRKHWGIQARLKSWIKHGRWLEKVANAKLERIRNGGGSRRSKPVMSDTERRRIQTQNAEAQAVYDRYFEAQEKKS